MATGTAAMAPTHTVRRTRAVRGDVDQRIEAIGKEAEAEPQSVVGMPTGARLPDDPFASLRGVAGWAVDYVAFLREPVDRLQGDPQNVRAVVDAIRSTADRMRELAGAQRETLGKPRGWTGSAKDAYQASMDALGEELASLANAVDKKGVVVEHTGAMVQALREALLYTLGQYSDSLVPGAINAHAFAPFTAGASIVLFLGSVVDSATQLGTSVAAKMDDLAAALTRQVDRMRELDRISDDVGRGWERFENAAGGGAVAARADNAVRRMSVGEEQEALRPVRSVRGLAVEETEVFRPVHGTRLLAAEETEALQPMQSARALAVEETEALRPMQSARAFAVEETEALRPMRSERLLAAEETEALRPMGVAARERLLPEEPIAFSRAEEPVQARHAVRESVVAREVQATPYLAAEAELTVARQVQAAPGWTVAGQVQATPDSTVRRVVEAE
ncbi:hypothetical protein ACFV4N_32555 [Actinosynnema sp. NPDC059797]